jgi:hypothetical protein
MSFETNECALRTSAGELISRGFVREHQDDSIVIELPKLGLGWIGVGDPAFVEVNDGGRGQLTYRGVVDEVRGAHVSLSGLRPESVKQRRAAVRVPTNHVVPIVARVTGPDDEEPLESPWHVTVIDLSAHGMRFLHNTALEPGTRWRVILRSQRGELRLKVEVLRAEEVRGAYAHGCRFLDISEAEQDALFAWVLELQRVLLARRVDRS